MPKDTKISSKNTKNEILEAYNEIFKQMSEAKTTTSGAEKQSSRAAAVIKEAVATNKTELIHKIADLKIELTKSLDDLGEQLVAERHKLHNIREALSIEDAKLKELYEINATAESLEVLLVAHAEKSKKLEQEIASKTAAFQEEQATQRALWEKEKKAQALLQKETQELAEKKKQRKEEEYTYKLGLERQKDRDQYEQKKAALEQELAVKKQQVEEELATLSKALIAQEEEVKALQIFKEKTEKTLPTTLAKAREEERTQLQQQFDYTVSLQAKETEGKIALLEQSLAAYKEKLTEKETIIASLSSQLQLSQEQSQELAKKIIEGASQTKRFLSEITPVKEEDTKSS